MYILHNRLSLLSLLLLASLATMAQTTTTNAATTKRDSLKPQKHIGDETILLQGITVMGRNEARQLRESGMPVSVMTSKELQGTASSMNDVLARVAGVTIRNTGGVGSASRLSVRGLEGKRLGLFVDETAMNQFSNFITLNDIPTDMIARIEIYKGIVPYKFGGSALGGAINVVTKEYPPIYFDASYEIGSFNTHRLNTVFKRTYAPLGLQFGMGGFFTYSANNYYMTLHNLGDLRVRRNHDAFRKGVIAGSIKATKWWFDELKAELIYTATNQQLQGIDLDVREAYTHSQAIATSLKAKRETFFIDGLAFDFEAAFDIGNYGVSDYAKTVYDWFGNSRPSQSPLGGETSTHPYDGHNKNLDGTGKLNLNYTINRHHSLNLNLYEAYTKLKPHDELMDAAYGFRTQFDSYMNSLTAGLSYDLLLFRDRFQSAFTLRSYHYHSSTEKLPSFYVPTPEQVRVTKHSFGWNESMRYRLTPELMFKASYSDEMRIPSDEELVGNGYSILPSPTLKPEHVRSCNLGTLYRRTLKTDGIFEAEVNGFYTHLTDMIRYTPSMVPTLAQYVNVGETTTYGIEGEVKWDVLPWLYTYANATYQNLRDTQRFTEGSTVPNPTYRKRIPNIPYLLGNAGIECHRENLIGKRSNTRFLIDASYVHQYFYDYEMTIYQDRKIPTAITFDTALEHSVMNQTLTFSLKIKNVLNREVVSELNHPLPGRYVAFKVRYLLH